MFLSPSPTERPQREKASGRSVPYLFTHRNAPAFRIPSDLQPCLGKKEYRRSLGRCYAAEAKLRALRLATAAFEVFSLAREAIRGRKGGLGTTRELPKLWAGYTTLAQKKEEVLVGQENPGIQSGYTNDLQGRALSSLSDEELRAIAEERLLLALKANNLFTLQTEHMRLLSADTVIRKSVKGDWVMPAQQRQPTTQEIDEHLQADAETCRNIKDVYQRELRERQVSESTAIATDKTLVMRGIKADPKTESRTAVVAVPPEASAPYLKVCQEFLKARVSFYGIMEQNTQGEYSAYDATAADSYSNAVSNWYQRYRKAIGITKGSGGGKKDFHSFRDTIAYWCDQIGEINEKPAARYLGHAYGSMTFGVYSKDTAPHILYEAITEPFTEYARTFLDIEGLQKSIWAGFV